MPWPRVSTRVQNSPLLVRPNTRIGPGRGVHRQQIGVQLLLHQALVDLVGPGREFGLFVKACQMTPLPPKMQLDRCSAESADRFLYNIKGAKRDWTIR